MTTVRPGRYEGEAEGLRFEFRIECDRQGDVRIVSGDIWNRDASQFYATLACTDLAPADGGRTVQGPVVFRGNPELFSGFLSLTADERGVGTFQLSVDMERGYRDQFAGRIDWAGTDYRRLTIEIDGIADARPPAEYRGYDGLPMTVERAFHDAGFEVNVITDPFRGPRSDRQRGYSLAEIHRAMEQRRSHAEEPGLHAHVFVCSYMEGRDNRGVLGIMYDFERYDLNRRPREGVAVFYDHPMLSDPRLPADRRDREFTYTVVHEVGHALNLLHSFDKARPAALSWMNYPDLYPRGYEAGDRDGTREFWRRFEERFDDEELRHLRHASPREIRAGGFAFGTYEEGASAPFDGTAEPRRTRLGANPLRRTDSVKLTLAPVKPQYDLGEPVFLSIGLENVGGDVVRTPDALDPSEGYVRLMLRTPDGRVIPYRPPVRLCKQARALPLHPGEKAPGFAGMPVFLSADGPTFVEPGPYDVVAELIGLDGARNVVSAPAQIFIRPPDRATQALARDLWDHADVMRALYLQQPLVAHDAWNEVEDAVSRARLPADNTTAAYFNYVAARGWLTDFAPPGEPPKTKNLAKASQRLERLNPRGLPPSVAARQRAVAEDRQVAGLMERAGRTIPTRPQELMREQVPPSGLFGTLGLDAPARAAPGPVSPFRVVPRLRGLRAFADIVYWNIEHLHAPGNFPKIPGIAELIRSFRCDFWGLQEVDEDSLRRLVDAVNGTGGVRYDFRVVEGNGQQSGAVFRTDTTSVERLEVPRGMFKNKLKVELSNGSKVERTVFLRPPLLCDVRVRQATSAFDFRCAIVHLKSTDNQIKDTGNALRGAAAKELADWLEADRSAGNEQDYIILGDMNAETARQGLEDFTTSQGLNLLSVGMQEKYGTDQALTRVKSKRLLDHIVVTSEASASMPAEDEDEQIIIRSDTEISNWTKDMSDHVPVAVRFVIGEDRDPG